MAGYIGSKASVVSSGAERKKVITATAGQTSFTGLSYTVNNVHVFQNGVRLVDGTDYTATDGTSLTLTVGALADDQVVVVSYSGFQTSDTVSSSAGGTFAGDVNFTGAFTSQGIDDNATSTAMTLDASGNLLVGKTSQNINNVGVEVGGASDGYLSVTRSSGTVGFLNRQTSDGTLLDLRKDGTTVGSIGTKNGALHIGSTTGSDSYLGFYSNSIIPTTSDGSDRNNAIDLGYTDSRFQDLYLSGGVYLGGTGAANKLDDYEEGTWTPTLKGGTTTGGASYIARYGYYTKVGNIIQISMVIAANSVTGTGDMIIDGLPFTTGSGSIDSVFSFQWNACTWSGPSAEKQTVIPMLYQTNNTTIGFRASDYRSSYAHAQVQLIGSGAITYARITGTYRIGTT